MKLFTLEEELVKGIYLNINDLNPPSICGYRLTDAFFAHILEGIAKKVVATPGSQVIGSLVALDTGTVLNRKFLPSTGSDDEYALVLVNTVPGKLDSGELSEVSISVKESKGITIMGTEMECGLLRYLVLMEPGSFMTVDRGGRVMVGEPQSLYMGWLKDQTTKRSLYLHSHNYMEN